jgi:ABC-2 type transport system ATP-binding protein
LLTINHYKKNYGSRTILEIPDFEITPGIYWVKGGNGSGKSTLFKSIAGIIPHQGEICLHGISKRKQPKAYRQLLSYAEAEPLYPEYLKGTELLAFVAQARKVSKQDWMAICDRLDMSGYIHEACGTYSSGMLKKLSLALALMSQLPLILLDEAFITIDQPASRKLCEIIRDYHQKGSSFLISSHQNIDHNMLVLDGEFEINQQQLNKTVAL